ncbi:MAG: hypothetical protein J7501_04790 [Bdellovibrio sp.]|nr:hypothetical protein [Bdellovibrio sp.]
MLALLSAALLVSAQNASAFLVATEPARLNPSVPTDIFVAGLGVNQGTQFLQSAILGAKISRDRFPQRQRVIISALNDSVGYESGLLEKAGLQSRKADDDHLTGDRLVATLESLGVKARSLQFYGHSNTYNGFRLQTKYKRLDHDDEAFAKIGRFMDSKSFAVFHSCNSAWFLAPTAAKLWNRPVFGSFAGSNFQNLMTDGNWYYNDPGLYPSNLNWKNTTTQLTKASLSCGDGRCVRLKPVNHNYYDSFGRFEKGLGFYKGFAPSASMLPQAVLHFTMMTPTTTPMTLQSSREDFAKAIADWMCPSDRSHDKYDACLAAIQNEEFKSKPNLSFYENTSIACDHISCNTAVKCKAFKVVFSVPCKTVELREGRSTVFSDQLKYGFQGFDQLSRGEISL